MAAVYKAYQANMDRQVAIKILPRQYAGETGFLARFRREAKAIAGLEHPHIIPVYDYGEADGYTYLVMRLVPGGTLAERLRKGPLEPEETVRLLSQIASALDYAHAGGVIHRDVKPSNVLLDAQGNALLTDFGIAKIVEGATLLTVSGAFLGTPRYASPEQGKGDPLTTRSDVYSLGVILYEMVTGRAPFEAETPLALIYKHAHDPLPLPSSLNPNVPPAVEQAILKALAKDPADRFTTSGDLAKAVAEGYQATPTPLTSPTITAAPPATREFPWRWAAVAALVGTLLIAAAIVLLGRLSPGVTPSSPDIQVPTSIAAQPSQVPAIEPSQVALPVAPQIQPRVAIDSSNLSAMAVQSLLSHGTTRALAIEGSGTVLAVGGGMGAWLYQLDTMEPLFLLDPGAEVAGLALSPDGTDLATAGIDGRIHIWDVNTGERRVSLEASQASLSAVAWSSDGGRLVSAAYDGTIQLWQTDTWQPDGVIPDLTQGAQHLAWIPGTDRFASGSFDGTVRIWDADLRALVELLGSHDQRVEAVAVSPDGHRLASGGADWRILVWDLDRGAEIHELFANGFDMVGLAWSQDGETLAEASALGYLGELAMWNVEREETEERLDDVFLDALTAIAWNAPSDRIAVATRRGKLALWDSDTGQLLSQSQPHTDSATSLAWSPDGTMLVTTTSEGRIQVWDTQAQGEVSWNILDAVGIDVAWSPRGDALAVASSGGSAYLLDSADAGELDELRSGEGFAYTVAWSPDGTRLALGAESGSFGVWDPATGARLTKLEGHTDFVDAAAWSPVGGRLASTGNDGTLRVWDPETGLEVAQLAIGATGTALDWSPDGSIVAVGTLDGRLVVWPVGDATPGVEVSTGAGVSGLDWAPEWPILAVTTNAGELQMYDPGTGALLFQEHAHNGAIDGLAFSPDGTQLATAGFDGAIKIWGIP